MRHNNILVALLLLHCFVPYQCQSLTALVSTNTPNPIYTCTLLTESVRVGQPCSILLQFHTSQTNEIDAVLLGASFVKPTIEFLKKSTVIITVTSQNVGRFRPIVRFKNRDFLQSNGSCEWTSTASSQMLQTFGILACMQIVMFITFMLQEFFRDRHRQSLRLREAIDKWREFYIEAKLAGDCDDRGLNIPDWLKVTSVNELSLALGSRSNRRSKHLNDLRTLIKDWHARDIDMAAFKERLAIINEGITKS